MSLHSLEEADQSLLVQQLESFLQKSQAQQVAILDKGGYLIVQCGEKTTIDLPTLAALAAGAFSATKELAKRLGESEFTALYHEGKGVSMLMTALALDALLVTVFNQNTNLGMVKFHTQETCQQINKILAHAFTTQSSAFQIENAGLDKPLF